VKSIFDTKRLLTFDLLRGYFLLSIILNHLYWYPNGLDWIAARGDLFVTAAEGFFLISGIILGIIRGRKLIDKPFREAAFSLLKRGAQLYVVSIVLMIVFTLIGWWFFYDNPGLKPGIRPIDEPILNVLFGALSFEYIYGWADYLRLYAIFLFMSPFALWLLRKGKWYLLILGSIGLWLLFPEAGSSSKTNELLMPMAWQLIFFSGFTIGFHWPSISRFWKERSGAVKKAVVIFIAITAITTIAFNSLIVFGQNLPNGVGSSLATLYQTLEPLFNKERLPVARLVLFALWFCFGFWLFNTFEPFIKRWAGWLLLTFGQHSLYVYTVQAFVIFFAHLIMADASAYGLLNFIGSVLVVGLILLAVKTKFLMKLIPR
jgi:hypothetical protein